MPTATTFQPDARLSGLEVVPSRGFKQNVYLERTDPPSCIAIHTTGNGPNRRFANPRERARFLYDSPLDVATRRIYGSIMKEGPHYVYDQRGLRVQVCPERLAAWHVGSAKSNVYALPDGKWATPGLHDWWFERWSKYDITSPFELAGGSAWTLPRTTKPFRMGIRTGFAKYSCNDNAVAFEVIPDPGRPRGPWSNKLWESLAEGVLECSSRLHIPLSPLYINTHSDLHPIARSAKNRAWDPDPAAWSWTRFAEVAGIR